jgi:hypothetical protein
MEIDVLDHLIITMDDGAEFDAGKMPEGRKGKDGKIRKIVTPGGYGQPLFRKLVTGTGDYNIKTTDGGVRYTGNATYTATLPAAGLVKGYEFDVKNASTVNQKVVVSGGQLIDGVAEIIIEAGIVGSYPNLRVKSFGTGYDIV